MDKKKKELFQTIILFILMFVGVNYFLYTYVVVPRQLKLEITKATFAQDGRLKDYEAQKAKEKEQLKQDIEQLKAATANYDQMVLSQVDTINMTYDFYAYLIQNDIRGREIRYTGVAESIVKEPEVPTEGAVEAETPDAMTTDSMTGTSDGMEADKQATSDPMAVPTESGGIEKKLFNTVNIVLELEMKKSQYYTFLKAMDKISQQPIYVDQITVDVINEEAVLNDLNQPLVTVATPNELLKVIVNYKGYVKLEANALTAPITYSFYKKGEGVNTEEELFAVPSVQGGSN